ncbi:MAG: hypothetical protein R3E12_14290 [Candidatus Eisenbacteria bacterium]
MRFRRPRPQFDGDVLRACLGRIVRDLLEQLGGTRVTANPLEMFDETERDLDAGPGDRGRLIDGSRNSVGGTASPEKESR